MSGDPKRWLDGGGTAKEKRLLALLRDADGPKGEREAIWAAMAASIAAPTVGSAAAAASTTGGAPAAAIAKTAGAPAAIAKTAGIAGVVKATVASVALVGATWAASDAFVPSAPSAPIEGSVPTAAPPPVPRAPMTASPVRPAPSPVASTPPAPIATPRAPAPIAAVAPSPPAARPVDVEKPVAAPRTASSLREESRLLQSARDALQRGDASGALVALDAEGKRFPDGVLDQERRTLLVTALAASGDTARASVEANEFARLYPNSPLLPRVRAYVQ